MLPYLLFHYWQTQPLLVRANILNVLPVQNLNKFACPCHGSQYNAQGKVVRGPAPLVRFSYHRRCWQWMDAACYVLHMMLGQPSTVLRQADPRMRNLTSPW